MTLSEVIPGAQRLSIVEKLQLIQILAADLDISPLEPFKACDVQDRYLEKLDSKIDKLGSDLNTKVDKLSDKIDHVSDDINKLNVTVTRLDEQVTNTVKRIDSIEFANRAVSIGLLIAILGGLA